MRHHTVFCNRLVASPATTPNPVISADLSEKKLPFLIRVLLQVAARFIRTVSARPLRLQAGLTAISTGLLLLLTPLQILAAQVTLAWDANVPTPNGYCVYQREQGQAYDYAHPVWPSDGADHTETTCVIDGLTDGTTYYFVVRAHSGADESGDSNEVIYQPAMPSPAVYTITASAGSHGAISPSGSVSVSSGANQSFSFTPNSGYQISAVTVDGQSVGAVSSYTFSNVTQSHTINVSFSVIPPAAATYTITALANSNGAISPSGSVSVSSGANQSFSFTPNSGYQISAVTVDGQSVGAASSYTFSNVTQNHTISVNFSAIGDGNQAPIAEAGSNQTVTAGDTVTLNGLGSSDPDGDTLSYHWVQKSGPAIFLTGANTARCNFTAPSPAAASATLAFELTVTDSKGLQSADTSLVMVVPADQSPDHDQDGIPDDQDLDDDNDGMPDAWEIQYNLDPFTNDANEDADGDGLTNLAEYQAGSNPNQAQGNQAPDQPVLTSPTDGASAVALTPWLKTGSFNDPDSADYHASTQWRIVLANNPSQAVFERTCEGKHLTQMRVPRLILDPSTAYTAQVRFFDNHGQASAWSSPVSFTTADDSKDLNKNNIPDAQEVSADTDMNGDGVPDNDQETVVKAVTTFDTQNTVAVSIAASETATALETAESIDPSALDVAGDPAGQTPFGLIGYKIQLRQPGEGTHATIYLSHALDPQQTQWVRYSDDGLSSSATTAAVIDANGLTVDRYIVDGGEEDADGSVNGVIVDLSGPRELSTNDGSSSTISNNEGSAAGGSGSGCFIMSLF